MLHKVRDKGWIGEAKGKLRLKKKKENKLCGEQTKKRVNFKEMSRLFRKEKKKLKCNFSINQQF